MTSKEPISFGRLVLLYNPASTGAGKASKHIAALEKAYPGRILAIPSSPDNTATRALLKRHLQPDDILLPTGGDGTVNSAVQNLLHADMPARLRNIRVLPIGTGRMNDIAHIVNGRYYNQPLHVLKYGRNLSVHPLTCVCQPLDGGEPLVLTAVYHAGFGVSGEATKLFNNPAFRAKQRKQILPIREMELFRVSGQIIREANYFDITLNRKRQSVLDVTFVSGHIFAGYYRLPVRLSRKEFFYGTSSEKGVLQIARNVVQLMTNTYKKGNVTDRLTFTIHEPVAAHTDGEALDLATPCRIIVTPHKHAVTMLACSPKA